MAAGTSAWGGTLAAKLTRATLAEYGNRCHLCGLPGATTADHLVPRSKGGSDELANLRPAHGKCNSARGARSLDADQKIENGERFFKK